MFSVYILPAMLGLLSITKTFFPALLASCAKILPKSPAPTTKKIVHILISLF